MRSQQKCWPFSTLFALLRSLCGCLCCWLLWLLFVARGSQGGTNKLRCRVARYVRTSSPRPTRLITILFGFVALTFNLLCKDFPQHTHTYTRILIVLVLMWHLLLQFWRISKCSHKPHTHTTDTKTHTQTELSAHCCNYCNCNLESEPQLQLHFH